MNELIPDSDRPKSLDDRGGRVRIIPLSVDGIWRKRRDWVQAILILIFLILPWTKINDAQTILLNIPNRQFSIFGLTFFAHDVPILFFLLAGATLTLAFVTAIWGRVWCGWACPQTVFIDGVFRRVENWIEGSPLKRRQKNDPFTFRKVIKWIVWTVISFIIAHSFIAYFTGSEELLKMMQNKPSENMGYFTIVMSITGLVLFDFGWFKEQFCIIMCPYGRVQSLLMDKDSMAVIYDENRGEFRRGHPQHEEKKGDCTNCRMCINVCPTACDIRLGVQLECIACTACIDACDDIMEKVGKPKGLIRYDSVSQKKPGFHSLRNYFYLIGILLCFSGLAYFSLTRDDTLVTLLRAQGAPYQTETSPAGAKFIVNHFKVHLKNQTFMSQEIVFSLPEDVLAETQLQMVMPLNNTVLLSSEDKTLHIFFKSPESLTRQLGFYDVKLKSTVKSQQGEQIYWRDVRILGPTHTLSPSGLESP